MSIRQVKVHGRKVWQARVALHGLRASRVCATREEAKTAESELRQGLQRRAAQAEEVQQAPATLRQLFAHYADDLEARGKGQETVTRAMQTCTVLEALLPELLAKRSAGSPRPTSSPSDAPARSARVSRRARRTPPDTRARARASDTRDGQP